jgi:Tfp pilus assembly protein PilE
MLRLATPALAILICLVSLSCQSYTTGVQQTVARADETAATAALHAIATAQQTYSLSNGDYGTFQQLCEGSFLDSRFNSSKPTIKDYVLTMAVAPKAQGQAEGFFSCNADPVGTGPQAGRHFYIDSTSSQLHVNSNESATAKDPVAQP